MITFTFVGRERKDRSLPSVNNVRYIGDVLTSTCEARRGSLKRKIHGNSAGLKNYSAHFPLRLRDFRNIDQGFEFKL